MNRQSEHAADRYRPVETNGFAIASLVLGIVWAMGIGSILALVFGYVAKGQISGSGGQQVGSGLATAGIVLGWVGVGLVLAGVAMMALGMFTWPSMPMMR